jgi:type IV pilus assembly protein PilW
MKKQRGISLIEVMVAITLGMLLMLGLGTVFFSVQQTFVLRGNMSGVQDSERLAFTFLGNSIRDAGFYPNSTGQNPFTAGSFSNGGQAITYSAGQSIYGTGVNLGDDTISVRFVAASVPTATQGCSASLTASDTYTDTFYISTSGGTSYLTCAEYDETAGTATTVYLVPNVTAMNIVYGVDNGCATGSASEYMSAGSVPSNAWGGFCGPGAQVKTARIDITFNNPLAGQPSQHAVVTTTQTIPYMIGL